MTIANRTIDTPPRDPRERAAWVKFQLELRGLSFAELARWEKVSQKAVRYALLAPSRYLEETIAKAIGMTPQALFPERFDAAGRRLHRSRQPNRSKAREQSNNQLQEAA
jgi:Ner family transcriptional regulator